MSAATEPKRRKRDGAATRESILAQALRLFARKGFDATSVKDIAAAVGVADAALYRHFPSKDDIAQAVFSRHYRALADEIEAIASANQHIASTLDELIALLCRLYDRDPDVFTFILINQHNHLRHVGFSGNPVEVISAIMRRACERKEILVSDPELAAAIALGAAIQPAIFHMYGRLGGTLSEHSGDIIASVRRALGVSEAA
ncbi:MAG: TetR/AcrR family transcriptional regulator [Hyphomicrobiales bacterium]|nr:TetR/AcrR family transcriptional regulator [Hyphomicrobiales bacterium]